VITTTSSHSTTCMVRTRSARSARGRRGVHRGSAACRGPPGAEPVRHDLSRASVRFSLRSFVELRGASAWVFDVDAHRARRLDARVGTAPEAHGDDHGGDAMPREQEARGLFASATRRLSRTGRSLARDPAGADRGAAGPGQGWQRTGRPPRHDAPRLLRAQPPTSYVADAAPEQGRSPRYRDSVVPPARIATEPPDVLLVLAWNSGRLPRSKPISFRGGAPRPSDSASLARGDVTVTAGLEVIRDDLDGSRGAPRRSARLDGKRVLVTGGAGFLMSYRRSTLRPGRPGATGMRRTSWWTTSRPPARIACLISRRTRGGVRARRVDARARRVVQSSSTARRSPRRSFTGECRSTPWRSTLGTLALPCGRCGSIIDPADGIDH
jgi:hypothetical protein